MALSVVQQDTGSMEMFCFSREFECHFQGRPIWVENSMDRKYWQIVQNLVDPIEFSNKLKISTGEVDDLYLVCFCFETTGSTLVLFGVYLV